MKRVLLILFLCTFWVTFSRAEVRTWHSAKSSVEGEFVELTEEGTIVRIRKTNGKIVRIPLDKLVREDQEYVKSVGTTLPASLKAGDRKVFTVDGIEYAFRWCPPGEFTMGSPADEPGRDDNETQHRVKITKGFWLMETEVTQEMWESVMGSNPSYFKGRPQNPVEEVSWDDCQEFCKKLSQKLGYQVQLPTEAQWEYACRAGSTTALPNGPIEIKGLNNAPALDPIAWYGGNSSVDFTGEGRDTSDWIEKQYSGSPSGTHPVGRKKPNAWGLYDMIGNVWEWCSDWYGPYNVASPTSDPNGPNSGSLRVHRGGSWFSDAEVCRSADRGRYDPEFRVIILGFRALVVPVQ